MDIKILSPKQENDIIAALKEAASLESGGMNPSAAIAKAASARGFPPEIARRMVEAFNSSKTLALFKRSDFDRTGSFNIADAADVLAEMYPQSVQTEGEKKASEGIPGEYRFPETEDFFKKGNADTKTGKTEARTEPEIPPDPELVVSAAYDMIRADRAAVGTAKTAAALSKESVRRALAKVAEYFMHPGHRKFESVEQDAAALFEDRGRKVMDIVWTMVEPHIGKIEKRGGTLQQQVSVDRSADPIPLIKSVLDATDRHVMDTAVLADVERKAAEFRDSVETRLRELRGAQGGAPNYPFRQFVIEPEDLEKDAAHRRGKRQPAPAPPAPTSIPGIVGQRLESVGRSLLEGKPQKRESARGEKAREPDGDWFPVKGPSEMWTGSGTWDVPIKPEEMLDLIEPGYESEMQRLQSSTMLSEFLSTDPVISEADHDKVIELYSRMAQLAPRAAKIPAIVQSMLRKMLQQGDTLDLYDINTLAEIEERLKRRDLVEVGKAEIR